MMTTIRLEDGVAHITANFNVCVVSNTQVTATDDLSVRLACDMKIVGRHIPSGGVIRALRFQSEANFSIG